MMTKPSVGDVVSVLINDWLDNIGAQIAVNSCIAASTTAVEVLRYFDIPAEAVACDVAFSNAEAWELFERHVPNELWPDSAWSVGSAHEQINDDNGYNGHVVLLVADMLIDITAPQYHRPKKGIIISGPIVADRPAGDDLVVRDDTGTIGFYRLQRDRKRWKHTPDYRMRTKNAGEMIRRMREQFDG